MAHHTLRTLAVTGLLAATMLPLAAAQETATAPEKAAQETATPQVKLEFYRQKLENLRLMPAGDGREPFQFVAEPLTTFENPISRIWDGMMFVWTDERRPSAVMKCYYQPAPYNHWSRTFTSLASEGIQLLSDNKPLWMPKEAGLSFAPLPKSTPPAEEPRRRLTQMRDIARRFTMVDRWGLKDPTDWQLRLLPTPLYRYEAPQHDVVDGALFGYVVNSPEALVLVEARRTDEGLAWHYAVARFTRFEVTVSLDGKQMAHFPRLDAWPPTGVYFHHPLDIAEYPFARPEK